MTATPDRFGRILVALDSSGRGRDAVEEGARLADQWQAELVGLYVMDTDVIHMAALPFTRLVGQGLVPGRVDAAMIEAALGQAAREAESMFATVARRLSLRSSFRIAHGRFLQEALAAGGRGDLVIIDRTSLRAATVALRAPRETALLCLQTGKVEAAPVIAVVRAGEAGDTVVRVGSRMAAASGGDLVIAVVGEPEALPALAESAKAAAGVAYRLVQISSDGSPLATLARAQPGATFVMARDGDLGPLLDLGCSVLTLD